MYKYLRKNAHLLVYVAVGRGWHRSKRPADRQPAGRDQAAQKGEAPPHPRYRTVLGTGYQEQMLHRETINKSSKNRALILYKQQVHQKTKYKIKNKQQLLI
jgi:DNA invertase Pin-like site-specific DNA recombinase